MELKLHAVYKLGVKNLFNLCGEEGLPKEVFKIKKPHESNIFFPIFFLSTKNLIRKTTIDRYVPN